MKQMTSIFLFLASSSFFLSQIGVDGLHTPELFTTIKSTVYIPCNVDTGTDHEHKTPISWTRVGHDGIVHTIMSPIESYSPNQSHSSVALVVSNMTESLSGTYTCHTDKGNSSTLVHVLDGESPPIVSSIKSPNTTKERCSENFELVHGKCLYYSNEKKNWRDAHNDCYFRTSTLITFKDVKDLVSFLLNLQKSGPTHYQFQMWTGHALIDESNSRFGALNNDAQLSPMLWRHTDIARLSSCGYLSRVDRGGISPSTATECNSWKYNFLCEQPTL